MPEDKYIQFMANYDDWVSIRKLRIEPATDPRTIMEFLASLSTGIDAKVEANMRKILKLDKVDAAIAELGLGKKDTAKALEEVNSRKVGAVIKEITAIPELQKGEQKEMEQFCRAYAMKKALKECGLNTDYSGIEIPGMKRVMKSKV
ncbi:MAG: DUF2666 family protein [Candidatus Diapherotrites archaeon]|uniref:DUF2666 family protein n=1 Tax=Candidatus Iainarchaeum sp. TaxID=3101447 RepID=A0A8T3YQ69_9ARCH|nr:DUF2666 family protein [Candidatus Diapherotrites archaeon]